MITIKNNISGNLLGWFKAGGIVEHLIVPQNVEEIQEVLQNNNFTNIRIIGNGTNSFISSKGYKGLLIKTNKLNKIAKISNNRIYCECGALDKNIAKFAFENDIGNLEFLDSIPGTIGGGVPTNTQCYDGELSNVLVECYVLDTKTGKILTLRNTKFIDKDWDGEVIDFSYRNSTLKNHYMVIGCILEGTISSQEKIQEIMNLYKNRREETQITKGKTCGSTFKNPKNHKAWELIKSSGANKLKINGVYYSDKHCNFLINNNGTAEDIEAIIHKTIQMVYDKHDIILEKEIQII